MLIIIYCDVMSDVLCVTATKVDTPTNAPTVPPPTNEPTAAPTNTPTVPPPTNEPTASVVYESTVEANGLSHIHIHTHNLAYCTDIYIYINVYLLI